jgi:hypothetical protein
LLSDAFSVLGWSELHTLRLLRHRVAARGCHGQDPSKGES